MHIVGGVYYENCYEGDWQQLFGSGLRAAAALRNLSSGVVLSTYIGAPEHKLLDVTANTFAVVVQPTEIPRTIEFRYTHALAVPLILPQPGTFAPALPIHVDAETVLRFGFIEGDAVVTGSRVVYDPQSAYSPQRFGANGSKAKSLAIVCNAREARLMSGMPNLVEAGQSLLNGDSAEVVVIKRGSRGALVFHDGRIATVPACKTSRVWPIGSGDVFASIFAVCWGQNAQNPIEAAQFASVAAAQYCDSRVLPIRELFASHEGFSPTAVDFSGDADHRDGPLVYLAGPFFNMMERWLVNELRDALLDQGVRVFSPFHDVGHGPAETVVAKDVEAIVKCDGMLAILDNLDSGTLFEVGYARAIGKPVVGFAQNTTDEAVKMLQGTDCCICDDLVTAIYKMIWAVQH